MTTIQKNNYKKTEIPQLLIIASILFIFYFFSILKAEDVPTQTIKQGWQREGAELTYYDTNGNALKRFHVEDNSEPLKIYPEKNFTEYRFHKVEIGMAGGGNY